MNEKRYTNKFDQKRLIGTWLLLYLAVSGWTILNIYLGSKKLLSGSPFNNLGTSLALDVLFGLALCLFTYFRVRKLVVGVRIPKSVVITSWLFISWGILIGIFYPLNNVYGLETIRSFVILPVSVTDNLINDVAYSLFLNGELPWIEVIKLGFGLGVLALLGILIGVGFQIIVNPIEPFLHHLFVSAQLLLRRLHIRLGRWLVILRWLALLILLCLLGALIWIENHSVKSSNLLVSQGPSSFPRIYALILDYKTQTLYAGADNGVVFWSTDDGNVWQVAYAGLPTIRSLAVDEQDGTLYVGTNDGIFRLRNNGNVWELSSFGVTGIPIISLVIDVIEGDLYAGTDSNSVIRLKNSSDGLFVMSYSLPGIVKSLIFSKQDGTLYAGTDKGVFWLKNKESNWEEVASTGLTDKNVNALDFDDNNNTLYAGTFSGVFLSKNEGDSWVAASTGIGLINITNSLAIDERNGMLYAGVYGGGIFQSRIDAISWTANNVGLTNTEISSLLINKRDGTLYAGTAMGVFRSEDNGKNWTLASTGMTGNYVNSLVVDVRDGTLYAGTNNGMFRLKDGGNNWEAASSGLDGSVQAVAINARNGTLFAKTINGIYRSYDGGSSWEFINTQLVRSGGVVFIDNRDGTLYEGAFGNILRSKDEGDTWEEVGVGLTGTYINTFVIDEQNGVFYAGTDSGVFRSEDNGGNWQVASNGLFGVVRALIVDNSDGTLYAGTLGGGVFQSKDGGKNWKMGTRYNAQISSLVIDGREGVIFSKDVNGGVLQSKDGGKNWETSRSNILDCVIRSKSELGDSVLFYISDKVKTKMWANNSQCAALSFLENDFENQARLIYLKDYGWVVYRTWGATITVMAIPSGSRFISPFWALYHTWITNRVYSWLLRYSFWVLFGFTLLITGWLVMDYFRWASPIGVPFWGLILARSNLFPYVKKDRFEDVWIDWSQAIRNELIYFGDVLPVDMLLIPSPLRNIAVRKFFDENKDNLIVEKRGIRLSLLTADRLNRWSFAWNRAGREMGFKSGLTIGAKTAVTELAKIISEVLGVSLDKLSDYHATRSYMVTAPALRLNLPPRFPLIFISDPQPTSQTVQELVDVVTVLKDQSNFALIVPVEQPIRQLDIPNELRNLILSSPFAQDFVVLSNADVEDILISRRPASELAKKIGQQIDLTFISPFIVNGPVPESMFFGRESEVQLLVANAKERDFAIVGNRKIGKTSLLNRIERKLRLESAVELIRLDCQYVKSLYMFYDLLEGKMPMPVDSVNSFMDAVRLIGSKQKKLVFLIDEIDAILALENKQGESVVSAWRTLAQEGACHFIFCGTTFLARSLRDADSAMFNFPQPLALGYLNRDELDLILTQPFETLGIVLNNQDVLLQSVWELTSGHPNVTQYIGKTLVDEANHRQLHDIFPDDVFKIRKTTEFVDFFFDTIWGGANSLEKIITLIAPAEEFRASNVEILLAQHNISVDSALIDDALKMLVTYSILSRDERYYQFVPEAFTELRDRNLEIERIISTEKKKMKN